MTLSQIRNRVRSLQRKYGLALAVIRVRPYADQFCNQWRFANANRQPVPQSHPFIRRLANAGFRCATFTALDKYIQGSHPQPHPTDYHGRRTRKGLLGQVPGERVFV